MPRMLRSAPHLRRGALLIRGPSILQARTGSRFCAAVLCTASRPGHVPPLPFVPRMLRSAPHLRRGALLIRGPSIFQARTGSRFCAAVLCTASRPGHVPPLPFVPRMLRSAPHLRRGALLIRGPSIFQARTGSRFCEAVLRTASRPGHVPPLNLSRLAPDQGDTHPGGGCRAGFFSSRVTCPYLRFH